MDGTQSSESGHLEIGSVAVRHNLRIWDGRNHTSGQQKNEIFSILTTFAGVIVKSFVLTPMHEK